ncbi:MAG: cyclic nucleotide-binding domain-containing protein [Anaerolineae bacterium]|nr:cyclic nucleotide-binding domain-containing protein [Anaerolineae bacterium]
MEAGQVLARQGEARRDLFIIIDAAVEATFAGEDGVERQIGVYGAGEHVGEYALFADTPYFATYRVTRPGVILALDEPTFDRLVADHARMARYVQQVGSARRLMARGRG